MPIMQYHSTRGALMGHFAEVANTGLAEDGGLAVPEVYPRLDIHGMHQQNFQQLCWYVHTNLSGDIPGHDWKQLISKAYTAELFGTKAITPLEWLEPGLARLKLSEGPTLAFKDVSLQLVGHEMEYIQRKKGTVLNIVTSTSGDTGSAAGYAAKGKEHLRLFVLFPKGRVSEVQRRQMTTIGADNVHVLAVEDATFDDCQAVVKALHNDLAFKTKYELGTMNSIAWPRIAAQAVYWADAWRQATKHVSEKIDVVVPSGNFGNAFAAYVAKRMGIPIRRIIVASNVNCVLYDFFLSGFYRRGKRVIETMSPSMDIQVSSNLERLIYEEGGRDPELVRRLYKEFAANGEFDAYFLLANLEAAGFTTGMAVEEEVREAMRTMYRLESRPVIDPHTAVGMHVALQERDIKVPMIVAETAQPAKFADTVRHVLGINPPTPPGFERLMEREERMITVSCNLDAVKSYIVKHAA